MRRMFKKNSGRFTLMLLASLGIVGCFTSALTPLTLEPAGITEIKNIGLENGSTFLIFETGPEVFFEPFQRVSERVVKFAVYVPRCNDRQMIIPLADYLLANEPCFDIPPPADRRSKRDPVATNNA